MGGTVRDADGQPVLGVTVGPSFGHGYVSALTDSAGRFELKGLAKHFIWDEIEAYLQDANHSEWSTTLAGAAVAASRKPITPSSAKLDLPGMVLYAHRTGYQPASITLYPHDDGSNIRLTIEAAPEVCGEVVDAETGRPVPYDDLRMCTVIRDSEGKPSFYG